MADQLPGPWLTMFSSRRLEPIATAGQARSWYRRSGRRARLSARASRYARSMPGRSASSLVDSVPGGQGGTRSSGRVERRVLSESLFRSALIRERKRADRFDEGFALLTIRADRRVLRGVIAAVASATGDTDMVGWMEHGTAVGAILTETLKPDDGFVLQANARLERELARHLDAAAMAQLTIGWYIHAAPATAQTHGLPDNDPLIHDLHRTEATRWVFKTVKRAVDVVGSAVLLLLASPVFLVVAALVKLTSSGPVLFKQTRVGHMARPFTMLKFRTMLEKNDDSLHQKFVSDFIKSGTHNVVTAPEGSGADATATFKIRNDPRTTPIGRVLRRTSIDELPQLWNVLRGEMSLVGPRPPIPYELKNYRSWHLRRVLEAKPGLTGLWQVMGRSRTTFDEMVRLDLRYARTRSLWLDLRILLATPGAVLSGKGAC